MRPSVLIIGAGMSGLTAGRTLAAEGFDATLIDKGRAVGGRMATRRIGAAAFDHGAQHISVRTQQFAREMRSLIERGTARVWIRTRSITHPERGVEDRYVGVHGMRRIPEALGEGLGILTAVTVDRLEIARSGVTAFAGDGPVAAADAAILTPPAPQIRELLERSGLAAAPVIDELAGVGYDATLAVMAVLDAPADLPSGHVALPDGPVAWLADNQQKGVSMVPALTVHSSAEFAAEYLESDPAEWAAKLLDVARPHHAGSVVDARPHRWRFARPRSSLDGAACIVDGAAPVVLAGEIFAGARVEGAYSSGLTATRAVLELLA
jgi:predicted NAD/FAD-dependent oxidoreductase